MKNYRGRNCHRQGEQDKEDFKLKNVTKKEFRDPGLFFV